MVEQVLRALLLLLSFSGLCEMARLGFKLNRFFAPYLAASGIILALMVSGMLGVLKYGAWALYMLGWGYWIWNLCVERRKPDWLLMGVGLAFAVYLSWWMVPCKSWHVDDFSHWTLAVDSLIRRDAFPDASEKLVTYQSYPMGATSFVYYVVRFVGDSEGLRLAAQNFLCGILLLPIFAHVRGKRKVAMPATALIVCFLFKFNRYVQCLQVDWLLSYYGIAIAAVAMYEKENIKRVLLIAIPGMCAATVVKNSGMFFAVAGVVVLFFEAYKNEWGKKRAVRGAALMICASVAFFLLWTIHAKLSYPAMEDSKHAVSIQAYAEEAATKPLRLYFTTAAKMALKWINPRVTEMFAMLFILIGGGAFFALRRSQKNAAKKLGRYLLGCAGVFLVWLVMLYAMYIFSMPIEETRKLASYNRYMSSGLLLATGMALLGLIGCFSDERILLSNNIKRYLYMCLVVGVAVILLTQDWNGSLRTFGRCREGHNWIHEEIVKIRDEYELKTDGSYIAYLGESNEAGAACYIMKYDLESSDVAVLTKTDGSYLCTRLSGKIEIGDPIEWMRQEVEHFDRVLMIDEYPELKKVAGDRAAGA